MNPDLAKLIDLHHAETELKRLDAALADIPRIRGELEARVARDRSRLEAARLALETSQKTRKHKEGEVQDLETKCSRYKGQLMDVKTNKEYTAMLHEIETVEGEIRSREDQILEEMERSESLTTEVAREEAAFRGVEEEARQEAAALGVREAELGEQRKGMAAEREKVVETIPEEPLRIYQRVANLRGTGVAEARDGMCQACHVTMRPQVWVELRQTDQMFRCDACNRILYYDPPPTLVEP